MDFILWNPKCPLLFVIIIVAVIIIISSSSSSSVFVLLTYSLQTGLKLIEISGSQVMG